MAGGRPSDYTKELGDYICGEMSHGRSLVSICNEDGMPEARTIYKWLRTKEEFVQNYQEAKSNQADYFVEEMINIPDLETDMSKAKLKVDIRKWAASKFQPKKYGDKLTTELTGANGGAIETKDVTQSDTDIINRYLASKST